MQSRRPKARSAQRTGVSTIGDVATLAGVSKMSVSRVLRDPLTVGEPLRGRIERAIAQLNYVPNRAARLLSGTAQLKIGLLYNHPRSAYAVDLLLGAMDQASIDDIQLLLRGCTIHVDDVVVLGELLSHKVDGVVLTSPLCDVAALLDVLEHAGVPAISVGTSRQPPLGTALHIDEYAAAYEMTRHIVSLGHVRIGFIAGEPALSASEQRMEGYRAALADAGLPPDDAIVAPGLFTYRSGLRAAEELLGRADRPTAIFASNDDMAAATIATAHRLGLDVPKDVTICGFDDSWIAMNVWPELTTVRQPVGTMGAQAVAMLRNMLSAESEHGAAPSHVLFAHELIVRQSDGSAPGR